MLSIFHYFSQNKWVIHIFHNDSLLTLMISPYDSMALEISVNLFKMLQIVNTLIIAI